MPPKGELWDMPSPHRPLRYMLRMRQGIPSLPEAAPGLGNKAFWRRQGWKDTRETKALAVFPKTREEGVLQRRRRSRAEQPELRFLNNEPSSLELLCSFIFSISLSWPKRTYSKITYEQLGWGGEEERLSSTTVRSKQSTCRFEKRKGTF